MPSALRASTTTFCSLHASDRRDAAALAQKLRALVKHALDPFTHAYIEAALDDTRDETTDRPYSDLFTLQDFAPATLAAIKKDCASFQKNYGHLFKGREALAGENLWFTRNNAAVGFWDGDWTEPAASVLTNAAEATGTYGLDALRGKVYGKRNV